MQDFNELSPRQKGIEVVRWLLLVPVALLASIAVMSIIGAGVRAIPASSEPSKSASISFWARAVPYYVLPEMVFVITGGRIAPRKQLPVVLLLMLLGGVLSLLKHVVIQHLAGNLVGTVNYAHFGLELAGLLAGVVCAHRLMIVPGRIDRR